MNRRILAILDSEENYAYRLMDFITTKGNVPFEVHVFTRDDKFYSFLEKEKVECLLVSENAYQKKVEALEIPHIIILSENGTNLNQALYHVNKYQSCDRVLREVMEQYSGGNGKEIAVTACRRGKMKIIGIYTPVGRCLQTTFSLTLGQMLARKHKTLYLNFEAYSGLGKMLNREFKGDLSDLTYYFSCAREKLFYQLKSLTECVGGLDFIPPADVYQSLSGIRGTDWIDLFQEIEKITDYEYLILDLSDCLMDLWEVLKNCDLIYTIVREDALAEAKTSQYEMALEIMKYKEITGKTRKWMLPLFRKLPMHFGELTYGDLAAYIRKEVFPELLRKEEHED